MKNESIKNLFIEELKDMYSAETQIVEGLPDLIAAAETPDLKTAFKKHLEETRKQVTRLEKIFGLLGIKDYSDVTCEAMEGLIQECNEVIEEYEASPVRDAALIAKAQRIEHYEISVYGTLKTFAKHLDFSKAIDLLQETQDEEVHADKSLNKIAEGGILFSGVNAKAAKE